MLYRIRGARAGLPTEGMPRRDRRAQAQQRLFPLRVRTSKYTSLSTGVTQENVGVTQNADEGAEKLDHSDVAGGNVKWCRHSRRVQAVLTDETHLPCELAIALLGIRTGEMETYTHTKTCTHVRQWMSGSTRGGLPYNVMLFCRK